MFTGLISDIGTVTTIDKQHDSRLTITTHSSLDILPIGSSIACNGICLTLTDKDVDRFMVTASPETQVKTTLPYWKPGRQVNLEQSLRIGDPLDGHLIYGHIDGLARVISIDPHSKDQSFEVCFTTHNQLSHFLVPKGCIAVDGVSLTINDVTAASFTVMIIPHTASCTTLDTLSPGMEVNLEVDMLARYVCHSLSRLLTRNP